MDIVDVKKDEIPNVKVRKISSVFLAVQDSSKGDLVSQSVIHFSNSKEAKFEPPRLAKIFFSDIQSVTLNYHTPSHNPSLPCRRSKRQ